MKTTITIALTLIASALVFSASAGDIAGRVTLKGTPPPEQSLDLPSNVTLAAKHPKVLTTRHYQIGRDGGLQQVLVYVRGNFDGIVFEQPRTAPVLDHIDGLFQPYVVGVRAGQELQLTCSDGTPCSFHATPKVNQAFSIGMGKDAVPHAFSKPEVAVRFKCDLHPWNFAYVGVFAHPYFAVTDEQGRFTISGVPAGRYSVEIFHPKGGTNAQPVVVTDKVSTVDFEVTPR